MTIYSHSNLSCYEQCPHKYKLQYIDKLKIEVKESIELFLGKRVHKILKKLYQDIMYQKEDTLGDLLGFLRDEWDNNWNDSILIVKKGYSPDDYLEMAEKYITNYYNWYTPFNQGRTIALEERILVDLDKFGDYKLQGYIDRLTEMEDGHYEIHEYKTCSRLPSLETIENDRQLALYSFGVKQKYPDIKDVRLIWHFLKFAKEITSIRTDDELDELRRITIQLIDTIESSEEFSSNPSLLCNWCKFKSICRQ